MIQAGQCFDGQGRTRGCRIHSEPAPRLTAQAPARTSASAPAVSLGLIESCLEQWKPEFACELTRSREASLAGLVSWTCTFTEVVTVRGNHRLTPHSPRACPPYLGAPLADLAAAAKRPSYHDQEGLNHCLGCLRQPARDDACRRGVVRERLSAPMNPVRRRRLPRLAAAS